MDTPEVHARLSQLLANVPDLTREGSAEAQSWVGKAKALVEKTNSSDKIAFRAAAQLFGQSPWLFGNDVTPILRRILYELELDLPAGPSGAFLEVGNPFDAMVAIGKVFKEARTDLLIVDPYLDETILNDFAVMSAEGIHLRLLSDLASVKPSLKPAVQRWGTQFGAMRPIEARNAPARALHDRVIIADGSKVWTISQSFKDLAARSPATILPTAPDIAVLKVTNYDALWKLSSPI